MIRTTREAAMFGLWRDSAVLSALVKPEFLSTARYEPVCRNALGTGIIDLLFENLDESCVISFVRLDANSLITRERSPFVWPAHVADCLDAGVLLSLESRITPWLRSLARARPMAREAIRRFIPSERFERARAAELLGAAPLQLVMRRMAPFVYARRFVTGGSVMIDSDDAALAYAILVDLAGSLAFADRSTTFAARSTVLAARSATFVDRSAADDSSGDDAFALAWYGVPSRALDSGVPIDVYLIGRAGLTDDMGDLVDAPIKIDSSFSTPESGDSGSAGNGGSSGAIIDVPSPAPLDLLFAFDAADAPSIARFAVRAAEPPLRACARLDPPRVIGGSTGKIALAMSPEALAMGGADVEEVETLKRCLSAEGLSVRVVTDVGDHHMVSAELVHIFGGTSDAHTIAFAQAARQRGVDVIFDVAPRPQSPSAYVENMLMLALRAASDDAETARYLQAYEARSVTGTTVPEPSPEEYAQLESRFAEYASSAVAVLAMEEDVAGLEARLPPSAAGRVLARGVFAAPEPLPAPIGHLVPSAPFAFVHGTIAARSHSLFAAFAAEKCGVPLVIAGACYDIDYLQTLRTIAPSAVVLADPEPGVVAAIYRRAAIWIDAAPRPRSAAWLVRAAASGALPVLAAESPLARIAGARAPTFSLTSFEACAASLVESMTLSDRLERLTALELRFAPRRDLALTFAGLLAAYARVGTAV